MIASLLIANRGEIACRIIRTARRMGIRTIAVNSDADAGALHVAMADRAVAIGPAPARESYLRGERIIAAALETGAEAIHPGYGFLSENAEFAQAVMDAGLIWVGPDPASITAMGLKDAAKARMAAAGVPVTPGYLGQDQDDGHLAREAAKITYPVLIKAVAGGGGKGMRLVAGPAEFAHALASCRREAMAAFGNDRVLIEKFITRPRHIEVQVFGDRHGNIVHLFQRDCSLQRRHQKVIEEAPAPGMDEATRTAVCRAAVDAARAVDYVGAGTVEFIADAGDGLRADRIWFMEMNTRLQVEHPVTEAITGVDLVEWQLRVASGEPLPKRQEDLSINGSAMEARLYAEDPARGFLPSIGRLDAFDPGDGVRVDTGVAQGGQITPYYDPMIAKLIAHGATRDEARRKLARALDRAVVWPLRTNAGFLVKALNHPDFAGGHMDTGLIARAGDALMPDPLPGAAALNRAAADLGGAGALAGFRLNGARQGRGRVMVDGQAVEVDVAPREGAIFRAPLGRVVLSEHGQSWEVRPYRAAATGAAAAGDGAVLAPMPGTISAIHVTPGQKVSKGQKLVTLEAMKMEHGLTAPFDGVVEEMPFAQGAQVREGMLLVRITAGEAA
ncbi:MULTISPECIES: acetyl/propionyl/methylcrotonyl-CoA carboxylase subunit alpha [unclassified Novosphingobium]|uniref:acetyl/propionyl/methylcrotonyl-CoA carboxylase subunit alpha n=1 Tax=unclassified Novosphingobium TaxID=2644732 RepID=UPI000868D995|nr:MULTISPECIES: biotin carboxylase N-terminal domain-containing protein [unclassified Novosphingobium]MBN9145467.1 ATP-grasp domain-containing protein [Novosphingobium sp.]MDR6709792.1 3-methylcrotonyl-CoA carboxylase alpha subunit [Novosphingobium sp. 1748]ODU83080.1 MAG: methylcrotonoyl-CoA carboxylase [Novosphingobium sp. SCN 63-17]OJX88178.1 MAG: methylcrotonoyl-CoA carboxylase [Novosphingobium sp. 63-713]